MHSLKEILLLIHNSSRKNKLTTVTDQNGRRRQTTYLAHDAEDPHTSSLAS